MTSSDANGPPTAGFLALSPVKYLIFSDSILFYTGSTNTRSLGSIIASSALLLSRLTLLGFPLRGAITKGELAVSADSRLFFGKGLVRAYELEQGQRWIGAVLDPLNLETSEDLDARAMCTWHDLLRPAPVPWQTNPSPRPFDVVDWATTIDEMSTFDLEETLRSILPQPSLDGLALQRAGIDFVDWSLKTDIPFSYWNAARKRIAATWPKTGGRWDPKQAISEKKYHAEYSRTAVRRRMLEEEQDGGH